MSPSDAMARARAWHHGHQAVVCDVLEPWAHGTVVRATPYPGYFDFNVVRVEDDPAMSVEALVAFADEALAGLRHRRVDFDDVAAADRLRAGFEARGWQATRLVWMHHEAPAGPSAAVSVALVPYDAVSELRVTWHHEDFPELDPGAHQAEAREVALRRDAQVVAAREGGELVGFAQIERAGAAAEITHVYVHPEHRGHGYGTAITRAAIESAGDVDDLWIVADDEDRPKELYARLGFRPAWRTMEYLRRPGSES
jgi:ribosomal protein S18 acetylase RimI-like enzyme